MSESRLPSIASLMPLDFLEQFAAHLPEGEIWPRALDSTQMQILQGLITAYQRLALRDSNLLVDAFPLTTIELLPEWEATLGLPDPCTPLNPSMAQRIAAVAAKVVAQGGQSVAYFISVAAALGYVVTVTEFAPFRVGWSTVGQPLYGADWASVWRINAPLVSITPFRVGISTVGDPLRSWGNAELVCRLSQIAPGHTVLQFGYS